MVRLENLNGDDDPPPIEEQVVFTPLGPSLEEYVARPSSIPDQEGIYSILASELAVGVPSDYMPFSIDVVGGGEYTSPYMGGTFVGYAQLPSIETLADEAPDPEGGTEQDAADIFEHQIRYWTGEGLKETDIRPCNEAYDDSDRILNSLLAEVEEAVRKRDAASVYRWTQGRRYLN